jgi:hypothetical protein
VVDPDLGLIASVPFVLLTFGYIDAKQEAGAASLGDPAHLPIADHEAGGDVSAGPGAVG